MSIVLVDGFDDGLYANKWSAAVGPGVGSPGRSGTGNYFALWPTGDPHLHRLLQANSHATVGIASGFYHGTEHPSWDNFHFGADAAATKHIGVKLYNDGSIGVNRGGTYGGVKGTEIARSATGLYALNTWNHIEIKVVLADAGGSVVVKLNNAQIINFSGDTKNAGTETVISAIALGSMTGGTYTTWYVDDVVIWNGAGATNNDFIGDCSVRTLFPNGNGNYSQLTGSDADSVDNYLLVDEAGSPSTVDYVGSPTVGNVDTYTYGNLPTNGSVRGVVLRTYAAKSDAGAIAARNVTRIAGIDYPDSDLVLATGYTTYSTVYEVSPATAAAWTPAEVNGAEFGFEVRT